VTTEKSQCRQAERIGEAQDILHVMRQCRSRLNRMNFNHAAAYADIAVQLLKQAIAADQQEDSPAPETGEAALAPPSSRPTSR
jgi:hypothetical protein